MNTETTRPRWRSMVGALTLLTCVAACSGGDDDDGGADRSADRQESTTTAPTTSTTAAPTTTTTAVPHVVYEIDGTGSVIVSYWTSGDRKQDRSVTLPWSEEQAEEPSMMSMLIVPEPSAQGDITCRIRRGTEVLVENTQAATAGPFVTCDYPPDGLPPVTYPPSFDG